MLYSLIYPYFYYCNIVWASTYKTNLRRLVLLQKRIETPSLQTSIGILKFNDIHLLQFSQFMFSYNEKFLFTSKV